MAYLIETGAIKGNSVISVEGLEIGDYIYIWEGNVGVLHRIAGWEITEDHVYARVITFSTSSRYKQKIEMSDILEKAVLVAPSNVHYYITDDKVFYEEIYTEEKGNCTKVRKLRK